jgi:hypothetical protein
MAALLDAFRQARQGIAAAWADIFAMELETDDD